MGWNVGMAELGVRELASILTTTGAVVNHSATATAMNIAAPIPASPFMLILSRIKVPSVAEDHIVLPPCRMIGTDERIRIICDHCLG